ncbi:MAG: B12-binding domain-containing radical SAM protein [Candidatus Woesearchaeota archaeon]
MKKITILEPLLNTYKNKLFFKSKEPNISTYRFLNHIKKSNKFDVDFFDFKVDKTDKKTIENKIKKTDYLFINVKSFNVKISSKLIKKAIERKDIKVFLYGQFPEARPQYFIEKFQKNENVHIIKGEIYNFKINFLKNKEKIITLKTDKRSMDEIPKIDFSEMKKRDYYTVYPLKKIKKYRWGFMNLTEGCKYNCIFCSKTLRITNRNQLRHYTVKEAIKRVKLCLDKGYNAIRFLDDDFLINKSFIKEFCKEIIKQEIKFHWMAQIRGDSLNREVLKLMKKSGCEAVNLGIESASNKLLKTLKKGVTIERLKESIKICKDEDILIIAYFMLNIPGETRQDIKESIKLSHEIRPEILQIAFFTPYEGSSFYKKNKEKIEINSDGFHYSNPSIKLSDVSKKELNKIYRKWYLSYYLKHPLKILRVVLNTFLFHPLRIKNTIQSIIINLLK